ncbi:hypothetical protein XAPC_310 [Xanthomonas citri pv. punicae str. LMG 859]|nr:hypothetical protein XAPC_310 [Xanthomonas citri pv. punicae str. LMG 859]
MRHADVVDACLPVTTALRWSIKRSANAAIADRATDGRHEVHHASIRSRADASGASLVVAVVPPS